MTRRAGIEERALNRRGGAPVGSLATRIAWWLVAAIVLAGVAHAASLAWTTDDAYISFRYARHLVQGHGLEFNVGERVEGYSNFLWTLWCALGLALGAAVETWANVSGLACLGGTLALLALPGPGSLRARSDRLALPIAAMVLAAHREAAIFATGGLETALFTLLAVAGSRALLAALEADETSGVGGSWLAAAGALFALTTLTRPDGAVFAAAGGALVLARRQRARRLIAYIAPLVVIGAPYAAWKLAYYGDLLPNTFYAKSAGRGWFDQGATYVELYFRRYAVLLAGPALALAAAIRGVLARRRAERAAPPHGRAAAAPPPTASGGWTVALAATFALAYTAFVFYVGGDFMFARLLIPATPFYAVLLEHGLAASGWSLPGAVVAILLTIFLPSPIRGDEWVRGIADERAYYQMHDRSWTRQESQDFRRLSTGLPLRIAFAGTEAIFAYESDVPVAVEASTGLTDRFVAHQPLATRGRVGHEKSAPLSYLIDDRRVHLHLGVSRILADSLRAYIPFSLVEYGSFRATVLTWDPGMMAELRRRGAHVDDFEAELDSLVRALPTIPDAYVAAIYARAERFYFLGVRDTAREMPFRRRLGLSPPNP